MAVPTYATPRSPDRYTDGPLYAHLIERTMGKALMPWQRQVIEVALERVDGPGSPWAYDQVVLIVGRRSGKTVSSLGVSLVRALAGPLTLRKRGIKVPFRAAHTAQNLYAARKRFLSDLVEPYKAQAGDPLVWEAANQVFRNLANTTLTLDPRGRDYKTPDASAIQVYAPTPGAVRGDGLLHLTLDEALVFTHDEGAALMSAARPTMAEFEGQAQQWITTNISAATDDSRWITSLRDKGRADVARDRRAGRCYVEFSMPPDGDPTDERLWWAHLPALADGIVTVENLRRDLEEMGPLAFGAEYLGLWPGQAAVRGWAAIPQAVFEAAASAPDPEAEPEAPVAFGVDIDPFGRAATIAAAVPDGDGAHRLEVIAHGEGSGWVLDTVRDVARQYKGAPLVIDDYGPGHELLLSLEHESDVTAHAVTTRDASAACYAFEQGIGARTLTHWPNDALRDAVAAAQRTSGRSWVYERRLDVVQTPLWAALLAAWGASHGEVTPHVEPAIY